eukprot:6754734-Prymnesium_polylepis.1
MITEVGESSNMQMVWVLSVGPRALIDGGWCGRAFNYCSFTRFVVARETKSMCQSATPPFARTSYVSDSFHLREMYWSFDRKSRSPPPERHRT